MTEDDGSNTPLRLLISLQRSHQVSQQSNMGDENISFEQKGLSFFGLFRRGSRAQGLPLIVLIHGGGATSAFFDNAVVSYAFLCQH